ncbi:GNAT family N-acetyltransferase [[Clostridium] hylemonae]|uniref:GNAT family N-acetyltransferase n=1 Tax=[Clostridium] hylemonae TaxID=89153 RepID=UPI001FCAE572|nr:GNAT family N-acetyltransferase [[Clostridium] hylemonae]BDF05284.1 N-acetyltransferase [[Clostridium] hylemonae]
MKLTVKKIHRNLPDYKKIKALYKRAFPKEERFPAGILQILAVLNIFDGLAYYDGEQFCGFLYSIVREKGVWLMYLAVDANMRSKGYGSRILAYVKKKYPDRPVILEVEEPDDSAENAEQRRRRIAFYKRNGFYETKQYIKIRSVRYEIMSTEEGFTVEDFRDLRKEMFRRKS